jgi:uncharacterized protein YbjT (DUF2867 family)
MLIAGGTGLVGRAAIDEALSRPAIAFVVAPVRRSVAMPELAPHLDTGRLSLPIAADLSAPPADLFEGVTAVGCAIGTTRKKAGSREAFEATDRALVVAFARAAQEAGVRHFAYVSSVGADAHSRNFYLKVKGKTEEDLKALGFASLTILRPSFLGGPRSESRPLERVGLGVARSLALLIPRRYRVVEAEDVARRLIEALVAPTPGVTIVASEDIPQP